ncbi:MAG: tyrosine-type recombinase/integrase [Rhizomicrobium sp.]|jgi:integrase
MTWSLFDGRGQRKYLNSTERAAFIRVAMDAEPSTASFCLTLALTGARISEILELTGERIDVSNSAIILETLKRRKRGIFRAVPVPAQFIKYLTDVHGLSLGEDTNASHERLWKFSRPTAWKRTKAVMRAAQVPAAIAKPKALRHAFGVEAVQNRIALSLVSKWLGHTKIETTAIYAEPIGDEERALAQLMWQRLPLGFKQPTTISDRM